MNTPDPTPAIVERVRAARKERGLSCRALSELLAVEGCEMPRSVLSNLEFGRRKFLTVGELFALGHVLEVPAPVLLFGERLCLTCGGAPPVGFACLDCGQKRKRS